jgi:hypothetical protein
MSLSKPISEALDALRERLVAADAVGQALDAAGGDQVPPWVFVYRDQVRAIEGASEALEAALYRHFRGDGGCGPHGDSVLAGGDAVRGLDGGAPCPSSRPGQLDPELNSQS